MPTRRCLLISAAGGMFAASGARTPDELPSQVEFFNYQCPYLTAWGEPGGPAQFRDDIYNLMENV